MKNVNPVIKEANLPKMIFNKIRTGEKTDLFTLPIHLYEEMKRDGKQYEDYPVFKEILSKLDHVSVSKVLDKRIIRFACTNVEHSNLYGVSGEFQEARDEETNTSQQWFKFELNDLHAFYFFLALTEVKRDEFLVYLDFAAISKAMTLVSAFDAAMSKSENTYGFNTVIIPQQSQSNNDSISNHVQSTEQSSAFTEIVKDSDSFPRLFDNVAEISTKFNESFGVTITPLILAYILVEVRRLHADWIGRVLDNLTTEQMNNLATVLGFKDKSAHEFDQWLCDLCFEAHKLDKSNLRTYHDRGRNRATMDDLSRILGDISDRFERLEDQYLPNRDGLEVQGSVTRNFYRDGRQYFGDGRNDRRGDRRNRDRDDNHRSHDRRDDRRERSDRD